MVHQGEAQHGAVGAGIEKGVGSGTSGQHPGNGLGRRAVLAGLAAGGEHIRQIGVLTFQVAIMGIAVRRRRRGDVAHVKQVIVEDSPKVQIIANGTDYRGGIVIQWREHILGLIGPRCGELLESDVIERRVVHGQFRCVTGAAGRVALDQVGHGSECGGIRRYTRQPIVNALCLVATVGHACHRQAQSQRHQKYPPIAFHGCILFL